LLSEDDNIGSLNFHTPADPILDASVENSVISEERLLFDDDYMLDTN